MRADFLPEVVSLTGGQRNGPTLDPLLGKVGREVIRLGRAELAAAMGRRPL
jgi:hypothetical protein